MPDIKEVKYYSSDYLPPWTIWVSHILIAIIFFVLGGLYLHQSNNKMNTDKVGQALAWIVVIFGILMITYHGDLLLMWKMK